MWFRSRILSSQDTNEFNEKFIKKLWQMGHINDDWSKRGTERERENEQLQDKH